MKKWYWFFLIFLLSCGHHEKATGGKKDLVRPKVVSIQPDPYTDFSVEKTIEITFSKPIKQNSIFTGLTIFPPILKKKLKWDKNTLVIEIQEELIENQNYYFTFSTKIKGEHDNFLDQEYVYVYANGKYTDHTVSGKIRYEKESDKGKNISATISSADSTFMFRKILKGDTYSIENLDIGKHILTVFIDSNENNRYDREDEAFQKVFLPDKEVVVQDLLLSYEDSTTPEIKLVKIQSNQQILITFSEPIATIGKTEILIDSTTTNLPILQSTHLEEKIHFVTSKMDTLDYLLIIRDVEDLKGNIADSLSKQFSGISFADSLAPEIIFTKPQHGETVTEQKPEIVIEFSELVPEQGISAYLYANEVGSKIDLICKNSNGKRFIFDTKTMLQNYVSYQLKVNALDWNGNKLIQEKEITFIVIKR